MGDWIGRLIDVQEITCNFEEAFGVIRRMSSVNIKHLPVQFVCTQK